MHDYLLDLVGCWCLLCLGGNEGVASSRVELQQLGMNLKFLQGISSGTFHLFFFFGVP